MRQFLLPDPGEGLVEAEIVSWHVQPGDQVKINDILLEVETSKSIVELPSPFAGTVGELMVAEGDTVEVGTPIISIDDGSAQPAATPSAGADDAEDQGSERVANLVGYGPRAAQTTRRARKQSSAPPAEPHQAVAEAFTTAHPVSHHPEEPAPLHPVPAEPVGAPLPSPGQPAAEPHPAGGAVLAKPPVRKLAKDLGLDLAVITGTGPGGVITRADVETMARGYPGSETPEAVEQRATQPQTPGTAEGSATQRQGAPAGAEVRIPIKGVRKATAQAMVTSAFTAPHVTEWVTCDVTAMMDLITRLRARRDFDGIKITPLLIIAKACLLALRGNRSLNASWDEAAQEIVQHGQVNLGIAAATPRGLVVPNLKAAEALTLPELADALQQLIKVARDGKTQPAEMAGGSFTITNVGVFGVDAGTPILNPGESGILAVGAINRRPWVVGAGEDERIEPRWVTTLTVSFDHRIVDGEQGSRFLAEVAAILADPGMALVY